MTFNLDDVISALWNRATPRTETRWQAFLPAGFMPTVLFVLARAKAATAVRAGKLSTMCKPRQRIKARDIVKNWLTIPLLRKAQNNKCCICFQRFGNTHDDINVDHVTPVSAGGSNAGNLLLAHIKCNEEKGDQPPSAETLEMLLIVNWIFGYSEKHRRYEFDWRVVKGVRRHYANLVRRLEMNEKHAHLPEHMVSRRMIIVQLEELRKMDQIWDQVHYRCQLSERMF